MGKSNASKKASTKKRGYTKDPRLSLNGGRSSTNRARANQPSSEQPRLLLPPSPTADCRAHLGLSCRARAAQLEEAFNHTRPDSMRASTEFTVAQAVAHRVDEEHHTIAYGRTGTDPIRYPAPPPGVEDLTADSPASNAWSSASTISLCRLASSASGNAAASKSDSASTASSVSGIIVLDDDDEGETAMIDRHLAALFTRMEKKLIRNEAASNPDTFSIGQLKLCLDEVINHRDILPH